MTAPRRTAPQWHFRSLDPGFPMSRSVFCTRTKAESLFCEEFTPLQGSLSSRMDSKVKRREGRKETSLGEQQGAVVGGAFPAGVLVAWLSPEGQQTSLRTLFQALAVGIQSQHGGLREGVER